jgi:hypothetical protein
MNHRRLARLEADYWSGVLDRAVARAARHQRDPAVAAALAHGRTSPRPAAEAEADALLSAVFAAVEAAEHRQGKKPGPRRAAGRDPRHANSAPQVARTRLIVRVGQFNSCPYFLATKRQDFLEGTPFERQQFAQDDSASIHAKTTSTSPRPVPSAEPPAPTASGTPASRLA